MQHEMVMVSNWWLGHMSSYSWHSSCFDAVYIGPLVIHWIVHLGKVRIIEKYKALKQERPSTLTAILEDSIQSWLTLCLTN